MRFMMMVIPEGYESAAPDAGESARNSGTSPPEIAIRGARVRLLGISVGFENKF
jgi:hypothetical protein